MIKRYTAEDILRLEPCVGYTKDRIKELGGKREALSARQIANLKIPSKDIIWVLVELLPERERHEAACQFAESVLHIFEDQCPDDTRPRDAIAAKRAWLDGEIDAKQLAAAEDAAWAAKDAAWAAWGAAEAAAEAAWDAAWDAAAGAAAGAVARDAAGAVARTAAWATGATARDEEEKKQVGILLKLHKGCT